MKILDKIDISNTKTTDHISFTSSHYIMQLCQPLFDKLSLNAFSYSRIYPNGSRLELWSDPYALEHTFIKKPYLINIYSPDLLSNVKYCLYENRVKNYSCDLADLYEKQLNDQKEIFNHDNCFLIIKRCKKYTEYFFFYTSKNISNAINIYLNNLDQLEKFSNYFLISSNDLIKLADKNRLIPAWRNDKTQNSSQDFLKEDLLSIQEKKIAYLLVEGKSAKEISFTLNISPKTAEHHIFNIKKKLNVNKKSDVILSLYQRGYKPFQTYE